MKFFFKSLAVSLVVSLFAGCSGINNDRDDITTLIITGNSFESRALAEHLQVRNNQPILAIPGNSNDTALYVMGPGQDKLLKIDQDRFASFIDFTNPKYVLILGNNAYVPESYINQINESNTKFVFNDSDWKLIAWQLEELTGYSGLAEDYIETLDELIRSKTVKSQYAPTVPSEPKMVLPNN